jgi:hypothetical protein
MGEMTVPANGLPAFNLQAKRALEIAAAGRHSLLIL